MPAGRTFFSSKTLASLSNAYLLRLPLGVSMITLMISWSFSLMGFRRDGSARPFFLDISHQPITIAAFFPPAILQGPYFWWKTTVARPLAAHRPPPIYATLLQLIYD